MTNTNSKSKAPARKAPKKPKPFDLLKNFIKDNKDAHLTKMLQNLKKCKMGSLKTIHNQTRNQTATHMQENQTEIINSLIQIFEHNLTRITDLMIASNLILYYANAPYKTNPEHHSVFEVRNQLFNILTNVFETHFSINPHPTHTAHHHNETNPGVTQAPVTWI